MNEVGVEGASCQPEPDYRNANLCRDTLHLV